MRCVGVSDDDKVYISVYTYISVVERKKRYNYVSRDGEPNPGSVDQNHSKMTRTWQQHKPEEPEAEHDLVDGEEDDGVFQRGLHPEPEKKNGNGAVVCGLESGMGYGNGEGVRRKRRPVRSPLHQSAHTQPPSTFVPSTVDLLGPSNPPTHPQACAHTSTYSRAILYGSAAPPRAWSRRRAASWPAASELPRRPSRRET